MKKDTIVNKAKEDNGTFFSIGIGLTGICLLIFALHWNFLFNAFSGPFGIEENLLEAKSMRKYLKADVPLMPIGSQKTGMRMFGNVVGGVETAKYMLTKFGNKFLIVKVDKDYSTGPVEGGITKLPKELATQLDDSPDFYPTMLDCQINYVFDTDLFMILAVIAFPFSILTLIVGFLKKGNPVSHRAISQFKNEGHPLAMVNEIETELMKLSHNKDDDSMVYYSDNWILILEPSLKIIKTCNLIGFGIEKDKNGTESVALWIRGKMLTDTLLLDKDKLIVIIERLKTAFPSRFKADSKTFEKLWNTKRKEIENEFDKK